MIPAGRLIHKATFSRLDLTTDEYGNVTSGAYTALFSGREFWCRLDLERMNERIEAGRLSAPAAGKLTMRKSSEIETVGESDLVTIDGDQYQIRGIDATDRRWVFMAVERGVPV